MVLQYEVIVDQKTIDILYFQTVKTPSELVQ